MTANSAPVGTCSFTDDSPNQRFLVQERLFQAPTIAKKEQRPHLFNFEKK
jgi:hypothetical protein